ncbi:MAG: 30S ribosomal protein S7 [Candidatus Nealsonbacteria bacterium]|nr:30S ribosomal protein S7 [Candidatus Nealsonbacteria bacterium]
MARRKKKEKRELAPDPIYKNTGVSKLINSLMRRGKKNIARKIVYGAFNIVKEKTKKEPVEIFEAAMRNTSPLLEVRPRRIGGATYQVPTPVIPERKNSLAMRWIINAAKSKKGKPMREKLAQELIDAANNTGSAVKKKEDTHRMAEANRAFAHFAW